MKTDISRLEHEIMHNRACADSISSPGRRVNGVVADEEELRHAIHVHVDSGTWIVSNAENIHPLWHEHRYSTATNNTKVVDDDVNRL